MKIQFFDIELCIVRLNLSDSIPEEVWKSSFLSVTRTEEEVSIVCEEAYCPKAGRIESGFGLIKVIGPLEFNLTGVLSSLLEPLAKAGISVFTVSTYDTDYVLVKREQLPRTRQILSEVPDIEVVF